MPVTLTGSDTVLKSQIHGPADETRQFYSLGNGDGVYSAQPNATNIWDIQITSAMAGADSIVQLQGGEYWTNGNVVEGDYLECAVIDKDNVLGYGANFELAKYVKKRPLVTNEHGLIDPRQASNLLVGLYLRTIYVAVNSGEARKLRISFHLAK
jgi:hypothetical protein